MRYFKLILLLFLNFSLFSQVQIKRKVVLNSSDTANRHVTGIAYPEKAFNATNAATLAKNQLIYAQATGINNLTLNIFPAYTQYIQGMIVHFKASAANTGAVFINVNNVGAVELKKNGSFSLDSSDLIQNQIVTCIYDGTIFQVLSKLNKKCPQGFVEVNKDFCIEIAERDTVNWYTATITCNNLNGRLCTQSEWSFACQKAGIFSIISMTDNMEWIDSAGNDTNQCKAMGVDAFDYVGCGAGRSQLCTDNKNFRCCYSK